MGGIKLYDYQLEALSRMKNGCILCGGVGSGKSRTSLAYYYICNGGELDPNKYVRMKHPKDLYIITTARKRDTLEWEEELKTFLLSTSPDVNSYSNKIVVDSWNNISKYKEVRDAFFIFDEQRVVGSGAWARTFIRIAKVNDWILLSATPGDTWDDYKAVFVANGYFRNFTDFHNKHAVYSRITTFPKIERYVDTGILIKYRNDILVNMNFKRGTTSNKEYLIADYDSMLYRQTMKKRWSPYTDSPIKSVSEFCYTLRKIVNSDESRIEILKKLLGKHRKSIIFYNFNYELEMLRNAGFEKDGFVLAEWNGSKHEPIPKSKKWIYLVQYTSGAEGWNCIETDTIIFFSQNYSYRVMIQAAGRIDRLNTPFKVLNYYYILSNSPMDLLIRKALNNKKNFNESAFTRRYKL